MRGYGTGQNTARLIAHHWDNLIFFPKAIRFLGMDFGTRRGFTQVNPVSPMIFIIVVDVVVRGALEVFCVPREAWHGMCWSEGKQDLVFKADDKRISGRDFI